MHWSAAARGISVAERNLYQAIGREINAGSRLSPFGDVAPAFRCALRRIADWYFVRKLYLDVLAGYGADDCRELFLDFGAGLLRLQSEIAADIERIEPRRVAVRFFIALRIRDRLIDRIRRLKPKPHHLVEDLRPQFFGEGFGGNGAVLDRRVELLVRRGFELRALGVVLGLGPALEIRSGTGSER